MYIFWNQNKKMGLSDQVKLENSIPRAVKSVNALMNPTYVTADKAIPKKLLDHCLGSKYVVLASRVAAWSYVVCCF